MRARDFCVAVKRLARLQSTIRQYNVRDTPGAVFVEREEGRKDAKGTMRPGDWGVGGGGRRRGIQRRRRGGFRADTEISPILEGWLATP